MTTPQPVSVIPECFIFDHRDQGNSGCGGVIGGYDTGKNNHRFPDRHIDREHNVVALNWEERIWVPLAECENPACDGGTITTGTVEYQEYPGACPQVDYIREDCPDCQGRGLKLTTDSENERLRIAIRESAVALKEAQEEMTRYKDYHPGTIERLDAAIARIEEVA